MPLQTFAKFVIHAIVIWLTVDCRAVIWVIRHPRTIINYELRIRNFVVLKVYDNAGREVATLVNDIMPAGKHTLEFNARLAPSYFQISN